MSTASQSIRTVLGDVEPERLGPMHGHEHVLFSPASRFGPDLLRSEELLAVEELRSYRAAGGSGLVDATVPELGRDPEALRRVSERATVHLVATTGHTAEGWWRQGADPRRMAEEELIELMVTDLTEGMDGTGIRAGVIKIGTSLHHITESEARVIRAAGRAQQLTGAPITTHTTAGTCAVEQVDLLAEAGAELSKACIGHLDRSLDWEVHLAVARSGAYLGYDQISKEKYEPDWTRARFIARLVAEGFGNQILLASDFARRSNLLAWGGTPGLAYVLTHFRCLLEAEGLDRGDIERILVDNPCRFLAWA